jgi:hypothetical protein
LIKLFVSAISYHTSDFRALLSVKKVSVWCECCGELPDMKVLDKHAVLDALMDEVGLIEPVGYNRQITDGDWSR